MLQLRLDDFTWQRPASRKKGFTWEGTGADMRLIQVSSAAFHSYQPHPGIFRDLASLEATPEAVLKFANRYGTLHERLEFNPFASWRQGIQHMDQLVRLSDAVTMGDWKRIPKALEPFLADASLGAAADLRPLRQKHKRGQDAARNEQAHAAVTRLLHAIAPLERLTVAGSWNALTGNVELRLKPVDLLDFMFLELGYAFIGGRRFRQCPVCGKWSLLTPKVNRADRTTCSDYCRLQLYRQRRAKAVELYHRGRAPKKIAEQIGSDVAKVKQWVSQAKR